MVLWVLSSAVIPSFHWQWLSPQGWRWWTYRWLHPPSVGIPHLFSDDVYWLDDRSISWEELNSRRRRRSQGRNGVSRWGSKPVLTWRSPFHLKLWDSECLVDALWAGRMLLFHGWIMMNWYASYASHNLNVLDWTSKSTYAAAWISCFRNLGLLSRSLLGGIWVNRLENPNNGTRINKSKLGRS